MLLSRLPLSNPGKPGWTVRLACIRRTASVSPEPGSNSKNLTFPSTIKLLRCSATHRLTERSKHLPPNRDQGDTIRTWTPSQQTGGGRAGVFFGSLATIGKASRSAVCVPPRRPLRNSRCGETAWRRWLAFLAGTLKLWIPACAGRTIVQREVCRAGAICRPRRAAWARMRIYYRRREIAAGPAGAAGAADIGGEVWLERNEC